MVIVMGRHPRCPVPKGDTPEGGMDASPFPLTGHQALEQGQDFGSPPTELLKGGSVSFLRY
jgi:hypothetical protein